MLLGIHLRNFSVLHDTHFGIGYDDLRGRRADWPIQPLAALIGRNSTGKTAMFDALSFLSDCQLHGVQYAATEHGRGGFARLVTTGDCRSIDYDLLIGCEKQGYYLNYQLELACDNHGRPRVASERVRKTWQADGAWQESCLLDLQAGRGQIMQNGQLQSAGVSDSKSPALAVYGALLQYPELLLLLGELKRWYFCQPGNGHNGRSKLETGGHKHLNATCDNVQNVLTYYRSEHPEVYATIIRRISNEMPNSHSVAEAYAAGELTSGSMKLFTFLLLLADPRPRPLVCLEQPDAGLYHDMVDTLAFEMRDYTVRHPECQILFTTHSPYILEAMHPSEVWVFERLEDAGDLAPGRHFSKVRCVGADPLVMAMYKQGVGMGALWYGGHFEALPASPERAD